MTDQANYMTAVDNVADAIGAFSGKGGSRPYP
jgi:hypothetical protein